MVVLFNFTAYFFKLRSTHATNDIFVLETNFGEKVIEFRNQDITKLRDKVDILVVSVFKGGYKPTPGTLVNALLSGCSVSLKDEAENPFLNLKENMNT